MTAQERSLLLIAKLLADEDVPYMVVGGIANAVWGEPRATLDIDITILVPDERTPGLTRTLARPFEILVEDPAQFIRQTRVLPLRSQDGVRVDLIFGLLPFEEEAIRRAVPIEVAGAPVFFCTAEDLILMKVISDREQDLADARGVLRQRRHRLDFGYLDPRVAELSGILENPQIRQRWQAWKDAFD